MSLIYNGTTVTGINYNGTTLTALIYNGTAKPLQQPDRRHIPISEDTTFTSSPDQERSDFRGLTQWRISHSLIKTTWYSRSLSFQMRKR